MEYKKYIKERGLDRRESNNGMVIFGVTLSKKCERLATAIYLVTNFLSDTEPLKGRIRTICIELVREASELRSGTRTPESDVLDALRASINEVLILLELAFIAGLVSEMNFTILKREFVSVRDTIELKKISRESRTDTILGDNFFYTTPAAPDPVVADFAKSRPAVSFETRPKQSSAPEPRTFPIGHSIGHTKASVSVTNTKGHNEEKGVDRRVAPRRASPVSRAVADLAVESRRMRILKLIKDNRDVTIKDIVKHFPDVSEKTIQRELVSFTENGVLKKSGERRWSRYALA